MQATSTSSIEPGKEDNVAQGGMGTFAPRWSPRIVYLRADISELASPLVPFAVFKENPLLHFHSAVETVFTDVQGEIAAEAVTSLWDQPFAALTDAQRYFLVAWSAVPHLSARITPLAELAFGIATPGPVYKRWITTCAISFQGEPVAWCIEIDMLGEQEEVIEIVLSGDNMQRLLSARMMRDSRAA